MLRHKRINVPGVVHHIIVRGINRQDIFFDNHDRNDFLGRLERALAETGCQCYAWALLGNHALCGAPHKAWLDMVASL
ncbi:MAG TPA: hypothetical protein ENH23_03840 [candidate division Zixibacteria bacterium]|nr:hypothetical protein [candidate division Zixibacteria bacterium]